MHGTALTRLESMASRAEVLPNRSKGSKETLGMSSRCEAAHGALALASQLVRMLGAVVQPPVLAMLHGGQYLAFSCPLARQKSPSARRSCGVTRNDCGRRLAAGEHRPPAPPTSEQWRTRAQCSIVSVLVTHPTHPQPLSLVVARPGKGHEPWYLLTTEVVTTPEQAWKIALAYARRWQIECAWRYSKSELAMESPRLWSWERREKLLLMATLVYVFLLSLLDSRLTKPRRVLLRYFCHRTGKRSQNTPAPLYRLRSALSRLWQDGLPAPLAISQSSG